VDLSEKTLSSLENQDPAVGRQAARRRRATRRFPMWAYLVGPITGRIVTRETGEFPQPAIVGESRTS
jgi:hypothetical protein